MFDDICVDKRRDTYWTVPTLSRRSHVSIVPKVVRNRRRSSPQAPHQMRMTFETAELRRLTSTQRANVLTHLANLLLLAASGVAKEADDDEC